MIRLLINLLKKAVKSTKQVLRHPLRTIAKAANPATKIKRNRNTLRKVGAYLRQRKQIDFFIDGPFDVQPIVQNYKVKERILKKLRVIEIFVTEENEILTYTTSFERKIKADIENLSNPTYLKGLTNLELHKIDRALSAELRELGLSHKEIERFMNDEDFRENKLLEKAYEDFMEDWKKNFYEYDPDDGAFADNKHINSKEDMDAIWAQIVEDNTFESVVVRKVWSKRGARI